MEVFDVLYIVCQLNSDASGIVALFGTRKNYVTSEYEIRACHYFECKGTQRFTPTAALGGFPGWECSEDRNHFEREQRVDFRAHARAERIDAILTDLHVLERQVARISDVNDKGLLNTQIRLVISRVQAERSRIVLPIC